MLASLFAFLLYYLAPAAATPVDQSAFVPAPEDYWVGKSCRQDGTPIPPRC